MTHLFDLIRFGLGLFRLQIEDFLDARSRKDVMVAADSLIEPEAAEHAAEAAKRDIRVRRSRQNLFENPIASCHADTISESTVLVSAPYHHRRRYATNALSEQESSRNRARRNRGPMAETRE